MISFVLMVSRMIVIMMIYDREMLVCMVMMILIIIMIGVLMSIVSVIKISICICWMLLVVWVMSDGVLNLLIFWVEKLRVWVKMVL